MDACVIFPRFDPPPPLSPPFSVHPLAPTGSTWWGGWEVEVGGGEGVWTSHFTSLSILTLGEKKCLALYRLNTLRIVPLFSLPAYKSYKSWIMVPSGKPSDICRLQEIKKRQTNNESRPQWGRAVLTTNFHLTQFWLDFFVFFVDVQLDEEVCFSGQWC